MTDKSKLIGKFCGSQSTSTPFISSRNFMTVRFSSDSTTGTASSLAFAARIETVDSPCGPYITLNATSTPQVGLLVYWLIIDLLSFNALKSLHFFTFVPFFSFRYWKLPDIDHQDIILQTLVVNGS